MTHFILTAMAFGRIALGLAPFVAPSAAARLFGFPAAHDTPTTRLMARYFGVRDIGLGVLILWALRHPEALPFVVAFNLFMDLGDLLSTAIPLVRRQGIDRGAAGAALMAGTATGMWAVMWLVTR